MFRAVLLWSLIGHLVVLLVIWVAGCIDLRPRPSTEIIQLQNVQMIEREVPEPPAPSPEPEPEPEPQPTPRPTPPPPPPEPRPTPRPVEPVPDVPVRRELPDAPERAITPEPDTATLELQRQQIEQRQERERQRQREEERQRQEEEAQRLRDLQEQARQLAQQTPPTPVEPDRPVQVESTSLGNYASLLVSYISRHWHSQREWAGQELAVRISMDIQRDGSFTRIVISTSSGDLRYDAAALEAVQSASPGPPLPAFITEAPQHVTLRLMPR